MQMHRELILEPIAMDVDALPRPLDLRALFGNDHELQVEIGSGKGTFLVQQAKLHPEVNYIGIEWARWFWRYASDRLRRQGCLNVRTVRAEASFFLSEFIPAQSVSVLHIYFPDPWPKKKHHRRRLIQDKFMPLVWRVLKPGGLLSVVTDHADYFAQIEDVVGRSPLEPAEFDRPGAGGEGEVVGTNFERKFRKEGRAFYPLAARKPADASVAFPGRAVAEVPVAGEAAPGERDRDEDEGQKG